MKYVLAVLLIGVPLLHGIHVWLIDVGSIPAINSARPLSWSSIDRIAASSILGKGVVLGFDLLLLAAGAKLLFRDGRSKKKAPPSTGKK